MPATSRQPEVTYTSCARLTLLRYSSGLEPGDSSPVHISPWKDHTERNIHVVVIYLKYVNNLYVTHHPKMRRFSKNNGSVFYCKLG